MAVDARVSQLILTIFALYARTEHNWLSVASVVRLMSDVGVDAQPTRNAVSRLKRRGVLAGSRYDGAAGYALDGPTLEMLAEGDRRIFRRARASPGDGWVMVLFSVPESERDQRHALRTTLTRLGFGTVASGVWVAPQHLADETRHTLERRGLSGYVDIFTGDYVAFGDPRIKVAQWWDLSDLTTMYADFLRRYTPVRDSPPTTGPDAFRLYIPMLTEWRRLPFRDPGLPLSLLPSDWNGETAGALFDDLNAALSDLAGKHAHEAIHT
ncbi:PaaX family transcriptional regulator C-terminal domain-containing protein [Actinoplanes sp. NPDC049265]|uniref:PaaX family transcriptional regulator n=1 Tax=Actinoplanes sp. NPDC049265 TaxID=3363902 RepID=UPI0037193660